MSAYLSLPAGGRGPGLLVLPEIWSINFHIKAATDYFAALGYVALAPALFWRLDSSGGDDTTNIYDDKGEEAAIANYYRFDEELGIKDLAAITQHLRNRPECTGKVGAVGYCFGGRMAFLTGVHNGIDAAASLYPTFIERALDLAPRATFPWSVHLPEHDPLESPEAQTNILAAFKNHANVEITAIRARNTASIAIRRRRSTMAAGPRNWPIAGSHCFSIVLWVRSGDRPRAP